MSELTDAELLDSLDALLRKNGELIEFWFDEDGPLLWAGDQGGDTLREALQKLVKDA